ncbi:MAG: peptidoglycan editing factor PgeF [Nitrospiraceae bacterium]
MASRHITIPAFAGTRDGVRHFFGTRHEAGRPDLAARVLVSVTQVHGTDALVLDRPVGEGEQFGGTWDALVTDQAEVLLTVKTADCVPVLVHDPQRGVVAAIHSGWRGSVAGILPRTLAVMRERFGSAPRSLRIGIGPSAGPCCYEVDEPVLEKLRSGFSDWPLVARETGQGVWLLDLRDLLRRQAQTWGVEAHAIRSANVCTICHPSLFHSYRRDGTARGTMVSGIMLTRSRK